MWQNKVGQNAQQNYMEGSKGLLKSKKLAHRLSIQAGNSSKSHMAKVESKKQARVI